MRPIRTAAEREAAQERADNRYDRIYDEVKEEMRAEWLAEFGDDPRFPFKPVDRFIHAITLARVTRLGEDE